MDLDNTLNSSDIEVAEDENAVKFKHLGAASIRMMMESTSDDRHDSKVRSKQLIYEMGAPSSLAAHHSWVNRFEVFLTQKLNVSLDRVPTFEQIERFIDCFPNYAKSRRSDGAVISYNYLYDGAMELIKDMQFKYADFKFTTHDRLRLQSVLARLNREGKITKDLLREKRWIGASLITLMSNAILRNAIDEGTYSWDVTISKILGLVLQSSLFCRAGDIARSLGYKGKEYLQWQHIELRFEDKKFSAVVKLLYCKGHKDQPHEMRSVHLQELPEQNCSVCPITLLIIHAMRTAAVTQTSIETLRLATSARRDKTVQWARPDDPVLSQYGDHGSGLRLSLPAPINQLNHALQDAADLTGIRPLIRTQDIRRGSARDLASLKTAPAAVPIDLVRRSLGHSYAAMFAGVTEDYIGDIVESNWQSRLEVGPSPGDMQTQLSPLPFKRRRLDKLMTDTICEDMGLDPNTRHGRRKAADVHFKQQRLQWSVERNDDVADNPNAFGIPVAPRTLVERTQSDINKMSRNKSHVKPSEAVVKTDDKDEDNFVEPRLLALSDVLFSSDVKDRYPQEFVDHILETTAVIPELFRERDDFVRKFSTINIIRSEQHDLKKRAWHFGGSKEEPTRLGHTCPNEWCGRSISVNDRLDAHLKICRPVTDEELEKRKFKCDECDKAYYTEYDLKKHKQSKHEEWKPQPCDKCPDKTVLYDSLQKLKTHKARWHRRGFPPQTCGVPGCKSSNVFDVKGNYLRHLKDVHHLDQTSEYWPDHAPPPGPKFSDFVHTHCRAPGCNSLRVFKTWLQYRSHLYTGHGIRAKEATGYLAPAGDK